MLSNKAIYALRAVGYLSEKHDSAEGPVQIAEIAAVKHIPLKFLEQILLELRKAGILESKKGKGGGYYLSKDPGSVSIAAIVRTINGPIAMLPCVSLYFYKKCDGCDETSCHLNTVFAEVRDATLKILEQRTLRDISRTLPDSN